MILLSLPTNETLHLQNLFFVGPLKDLSLLAALLPKVIKLPIRGEKWLKFQSIKLIGDVTK